MIETEKAERIEKTEKKEALSKEEFAKLTKVELGTGHRTSIVDWAAVTAKFKGRVFTYKQVREHIEKTFKKKIHYSEMYRWFGSCKKQGHTVEVRSAEDGTRVVLIE